MSAEPFVRDPLPGLRLDGLTLSEAIRVQGEARVHSPEDFGDGDLRLDLDRASGEPRRWRSPSRSAIITLWAVGLIAALGIASYAQVMLQRQAAAAMDASPPPPEAAPAVPTQPIPPQPILSQPAPITGEASAAPPDADGAPADGKSAAAVAADTPPAKVADAVAAPPEAKAVVEPAEAKAPLKPAKRTAAAEARKPAAAAKASDDITHLRGQLNHAYTQAVQAGVPKSVMKAREAEWTKLYAKAKAKSPAAVAALYRTRTAQLETLAKKRHPATARKPADDRGG